MSVSNVVSNVCPSRHVYYFLVWYIADNQSRNKCPKTFGAFRQFATLYRETGFSPSLVANDEDGALRSRHVVFFL
jgi:hypothetical protein